MNIRHGPVRKGLSLAILGALACLGVSHAARAAPGGYAVVCKAPVATDKDWGPVVEALTRQHRGVVVSFTGDVAEARAALAGMHPRHLCVVAPPGDVTKEFVIAVHQLSRTLDGDPYVDALTGILTGPNAATALRLAEGGKPLTVRKVAAATEIALEMVPEGRWYCELVKNKGVAKARGGEPKEIKVPDDTTKLFVDTLNDWKPDLFITSGHATERDWQIGYRYRNGQFRSTGGRLYGKDTAGAEFDVHSDNPKVYLPVGNCLMGHIDGPDAMALAWMKSAGVRQMIGYTEPTWYGYAGWGMLDYFLEQPGTYTMAEAFYANLQALVHRLEGNPGPQDRRGLEFDRDHVAFYGDPAWPARLADGPRRFDLRLKAAGRRHMLDIVPRQGADSFAPVSANGSQRGGRPFVALLPRRIGPAKVLEGADLNPVIADDFVLVPRPATCDTARTYRVVFEADPAE